MPPRARRPRGHIEPLPSGSFRAVVFTGIDPLTHKRQYVRETCPTRGEAEKALTRLQGQVDQHRHPKSSITVATAAERSEDGRRGRRTCRPSMVRKSVAAEATGRTHAINPNRAGARAQHESSGAPGD